MIALGIRYLCGWSVASEPTSHDDPEWPPHPARVFMAMVAAHFETVDEPARSAQRQEYEALTWLEALGPPRIRASDAESVRPNTVFVPVNDTEISSRTDPATASEKTVTSALQVLPELRSRQPRVFARAIPHDDRVWLAWPEAAPSDSIREGLESVCAKVTRIGHSSSFVQMWVAEEDEVPDANLIPDPPADEIRLRIPQPGLLDELEARFQAGLRPEVVATEAYGRPGNTVIGSSHFDPDLIVLRGEPAESGFSRLPLEATARIIDYFRKAVISAAEEPVPEMLSGHAPDGGPSQETHTAFLPLAFAGHRHADGHLLGLALAMPRELTTADRRAIDAALGSLVSNATDPDDPGKLVMGNLGRWRLLPVLEEAPPLTLRSESWTRPALAWDSVTPVVLDRFSGDEGEKRTIVADACERVGLPRPTEVLLSHVSPLKGVPPSPRFGPLPTSGSRPTRPFTHARLIFGDQPDGVQGPVLIGAGRYRGYGVFMPVSARTG